MVNNIFEERCRMKNGVKKCERMIRTRKKVIEKKNRKVGKEIMMSRNNRKRGERENERNGVICKKEERKNQRTL